MPGTARAVPGLCPLPAQLAGSRRWVRAHSRGACPRAGWAAPRPLCARAGSTPSIPVPRLGPAAAHGLGRHRGPVRACLQISPVCSGPEPDPGLARESGARADGGSVPTPAGQPDPTPGQVLPAPRCHWSGATRAGDNEGRACGAREQSGPACPARVSRARGVSLSPLPTQCRGGHMGLPPRASPPTPCPAPLAFGDTEEPEHVQVALPAMVSLSQLGTCGSCCPGVAQPTPAGAGLSSGQSSPLSHTRLQAQGCSHQEQPQDVLLLGTGGKSTPEPKPWGSPGRGLGHGDPAGDGVGSARPGAKALGNKEELEPGSFPDPAGACPGGRGHTRTQPRCPGDLWTPQQGAAPRPIGAGDPPGHRGDSESHN